VHTATFLASGDRFTAEDLVQTALMRWYVAWPRVRSETVDAHTRKARLDPRPGQVRAKPGVHRSAGLWSPHPCTATLNWSDDQLLSFADGVHMTGNALPSHGFVWPLLLAGP